MQIRLDTSRLDQELRAAIYAALFKAAYADDELHRDEVSIITSSIISKSDQSQIEQAAIREVFNQPKRLEECLDTIKQGPGDLPVIVFALLVDVVLADGRVTASEMEIVRTAFDSLVTVNSPLLNNPLLRGRLIEVRQRRANESHCEFDYWLTLVLGIEDAPYPDVAETDSKPSILLDQGFQELVTSIQHRKRQRAAASTLRRFGS